MPLEIQLSDPELMGDPFTAYGRAREQAPVAALVAPGFGPFWAVTRHAEARAMLADPRFTLGEESYQHLDVPDDARPYLRTMQQTSGDEHTRLRRLVSPEFSARRGADFRPRLEKIVAALLDELERNADPDGTVDLVRHFANPLPMEVICELVGVPEADRPQWRIYGAAIASGHGAAFTAAIPAIIEGAQAAVASSRSTPATGRDQPAGPQPGRRQADRARAGHLRLAPGAGRPDTGPADRQRGADPPRPPGPAHHVSERHGEGRGRGTAPLVRAAAADHPPPGPRGRRARRRTRAQGRAGDRDPGRGQPRPAGVQGPRPLRRAPHAEPAPQLRARPALLPGRAAGPGADRGGTDGSVRPLPHVDAGRPGTATGSRTPPPGAYRPYGCSCASR